MRKRYFKVILIVVNFYIRHKLTHELLSFAQFTYKLNYRAPIKKIIDYAEINDLQYDINNIIVADFEDNMEPISVKLKLSDGSKIEIPISSPKYGENLIYYANYEIVIYFLYNNKSYIEGCDYSAAEAEIIIDSGLEIKISNPTEFDLNAVNLTLDESKTQGISYTLEKENNRLFKINYFYNGILISYRYGMVNDYDVLNLYDAVKNLKVEGKYVDCLWSTNFICAVVDEIKLFEEYGIELGMHEGYSYFLTPLTNLIDSENITILTITDSIGRVFNYEFVLYLNKSSAVENVKYNGIILDKNDKNQYLVNISNLRSIEENFIELNYKFDSAYFNTTKKTSIDKEGNIYKIVYKVKYETKEIDNFEIVICYNSADVSITIEDTPIYANKNVFNIDYTYDEDDMWGSTNLYIEFKVENLANIEGIDNIYKMNDTLFCLIVDTKTLPADYFTQMNFTVKAVSGYYKNYVINLSLHRIEAQILFTITGQGQSIEYSEVKAIDYVQSLVLDSVCNTIDISINSEKYNFSDGASMNTTLIIYDEKEHYHYMVLDIYNESNILCFNIRILVNFQHE